MNSLTAGNYVTCRQSKSNNCKVQIPQQKQHTSHQTNQVNFTYYLSTVWYIVKLDSYISEDNE